MRYCAFGRAVESDRPLPELPPAPASVVSAAPQFTIAWRARVACRADLRWSVVWPALGAEPAVLFARLGEAAFLRAGDVATVTISGGRIDVDASAGADPEGVRHLLLDRILPLALAAAGEMVLHASAVEVDGSAVLFVGDTGAGKSTLAAGLSGCGAAVLADDGVLLETRGADVCALPSYRGLRLWPDSADRAGARGFSVAPRVPGTRKARLLPIVSECCSRALPVAAVYALHPGDARTSITRLSRRDAALALVRHAFTPDVESRAAILAHFDRAAVWAGRLEVWRLAAPRDLSQLPRLARAVLAHVGSCRASVTLKDR